MDWLYGTAVIQETLEPGAWAHLRRLAALEYGRSTGSAFVLAQAPSLRANGVRPDAGGRLASLMRRFARVRTVAQPRTSSAARSGGAEE